MHDNPPCPIESGPSSLVSVTYLGFCRDVVEPTPCVPGLRIKQVSAGGMHSCVLTDTGEVRSCEPVLKLSWKDTYRTLTHLARSPLLHIVSW